jgi:hypothetical protein
MEEIKAAFKMYDFLGKAGVDIQKDVDELVELARLQAAGRIVVMPEEGFDVETDLTKEQIAAVVARNIALEELAKDFKRKMDEGQLVELPVPVGSSIIMSDEDCWEDIRVHLGYTSRRTGEMNSISLGIFKNLLRDGHARPVSNQKCRVCGCTDDNACPGSCWWVEPDLCSVCAEKMAAEQ